MSSYLNSERCLLHPHHHNPIRFMRNSRNSRAENLQFKELACPGLVLRQVSKRDSLKKKCVSAVKYAGTKCLSSSADIPQNTSPRRGLIDAPSLKMNGLGGGVTGSPGTAGLLPGLHLSTNAITPAKKLSPIEMEDLIHLPGPLTEDAVMKTLQARFGESKYFVSIFIDFLTFYRKHNNLKSNLIYWQNQ